MSSLRPILGSKYVPKYAGKYFDRPWHEKDLMGYFKFCDYQDLSKDPTNYFEKKGSLISILSNVVVILCKGHIRVIKQLLTKISNNIQNQLWEAFLETSTERIMGRKKSSFESF